MTLTAKYVHSLTGLLARFSQFDDRPAGVGAAIHRLDQADVAQPHLASYKAGVGDTRESPALKIARLLRERGGEVAFHDPHVSELPELDLVGVALEEGLAACDAAAIVTAHPEFDLERIVSAAPLLVDFRGVTRDLAADHLVRL
jgi:UDP-N-acetyl-D-mannosaminuronate dehydrogenase